MIPMNAIRTDELRLRSRELRLRADRAGGSQSRAARPRATRDPLLRFRPLSRGIRREFSIDAR